jgi:hypothetical protein
MTRIYKPTPTLYIAYLLQDVTFIGPVSFDEQVTNIRDILSLEYKEHPSVTFHIK